MTEPRWRHRSMCDACGGFHEGACLPPPIPRSRRQLQEQRRNPRPTQGEYLILVSAVVLLLGALRWLVMVT